MDYAFRSASCDVALIFWYVYQFAYCLPCSFIHINSGTCLSFWRPCSTFYIVPTCPKWIIVMFPTSATAHTKQQCHHTRNTNSHKPPNRLCFGNNFINFVQRLKKPANALLRVDKLIWRRWQLSLSWLSGYSILLSRVYVPEWTKTSCWGCYNRTKTLRWKN